MLSLFLKGLFKFILGPSILGGSLSLVRQKEKKRKKETGQATVTVNGLPMMDQDSSSENNLQCYTHMRQSYKEEGR